jgi:signal transduction histidine kinase
MVYMGCNDLQAQRLNLNSKEEIIGKTNYDLHSVEEADELNKVNNTVITTGNLYECEEVVFTKSISKLCNYLSRKIPLVDISGKIIGLLGVSVDITDRKKKEGIEKMLKIKEELYKIATEVAHDIASPVSALRMVQYMSEGKLLEKETKMLNLAIGSIEDMADKLMSRYKVVKNAALKIESKVVDKTDEEYISPYESLQEIVEIMVYRNKEANVEIKCKVDNENKFVFIKGDFSDFSRMMVNLVKNAADALEGKKGIIDVSYKVKREKGKEVEIRVKDNGKGMPKEMAEKLVKGGKIWTTKGKDGHGIGMQQVRGTIKAMNGQLKIESKENVGTEIILTFPKLEKSNMQMEIKKL